MLPSLSRYENFLEILRRTQRWRPAVAETAASFADFSAADYENLIRFLVESGADEPLGILLCVCGVNDVRLEPHILAETLKIAEPVIDVAFPYRVQNNDAIDALLTVVQAEDISWERQAFGAAIAAELAIRTDSQRPDVKKIVLKLS